MLDWFCKFYISKDILIALLFREGSATAASKAGMFLSIYIAIFAVSKVHINLFSTISTLLSDASCTVVDKSDYFLIRGIGFLLGPC